MQGSDDGGNKVPRKEESSAAWKSTLFQEEFAPDPQHLSQNSPQTGGQIYDEAGSASSISADLIQEHPLRSSNALASFDGLQLSDQQQPASGRFDDPSYADLNEVLPKSVSSGLGEATSDPCPPPSPDSTSSDYLDIEGLSMHEIREKFLRGGKDTLHVSEIPPSPSSKPLYQPLSLVNRETRVIRILPEMEPDWGCSFFEPIRCSLEVISLDLNPRYHALSYTWQDETLGDSFTYEPWPDEDIKVPIDGWIYLSNEKVKVTHNLWAALWHLRFLASWLQRDPDAHRVYSGRDSKSVFTFDIPIWIDALCINQSNISERNQQVPHMYSIYQNAELVHVWLGPTVPDIDKMRNLIVELAKYPRTFEGHGDNRHKDPTNSSSGGKNADCFRESLKDKIFKPEFKTGWDAVMSALERPYWKRVWIIQELASNPNYKIYIGLQIIDLIALCAGFFKLSASTFFDQETILENLGEWAMSLFKSWATVAKFSEHQIAHSEPKFPGHSLVYLLDTYKGQKCSDPRDLVYGFIGMSAPYSDAKLPIDYSETVSLNDVFKATSRYIILGSKSLDVICNREIRACRCNDPCHKSFELPSWVRDWRCDRFTNGELLPPEKAPDQEPDHLAPTAVISNDGNILKTRARILGQIKFHPFLDWTREDMAHPRNLAPCFHEILQFILCTFFTHWSESFNRQTLATTLETLYPLLFYRAKNVPELQKLMSKNYFIDSFMVVMAEYGETMAEWGEGGRLETHERLLLLAVLKDINLFTISNQQSDRVSEVQSPFILGRCHSVCRSGDTLAIIYGCQYPLLLYRDQDNATRYKIRDVPYVRGYIHGETVGKSEVVDLEIS